MMVKMIKIMIIMMPAMNVLDMMMGDDGKEKAGNILFRIPNKLPNVIVKIVLWGRRINFYLCPIGKAPLRRATTIYHNADMLSIWNIGLFEEYESSPAIENQCKKKMKENEK